MDPVLELPSSMDLVASTPKKDKYISRLLSILDVARIIGEKLGGFLRGGSSLYIRISSFSTMIDYRKDRLAARFSRSSYNTGSKDGVAVAIEWKKRWESDDADR